MGGTSITSVLSWLGIGLLPLVSGIILWRKAVREQAGNQNRLKEIRRAIADGDPAADEYEVQAEMHRLENELMPKTSYSRTYYSRNSAETMCFVAFFLMMAGGLILGLPLLIMCFVLLK